MERSRRSDAVRNRDRIIEVARRRFDAGDDELPLNVIAAEAGLGVGTVYRNFPSRLALLSALAEPHLSELLFTTRALAASDGTRPFDDAFRQAVSFFGAHAELLRVVSDSAPDDDWAAPSLGPMAEALGDLLSRAIAAGEIRAGITVEVVQHLVCAVDYAARLSNDPQSRSTLTGIALRGIQAGENRPADVAGRR